MKECSNFIARPLAGFNFTPRHSIGERIDMGGGQYPRALHRELSCPVDVRSLDNPTVEEGHSVAANVRHQIVERKIFGALK